VKSCQRFTQESDLSDSEHSAGLTGAGGRLDLPVSVGVSNGGCETAGHTAAETGSSTVSVSVSVVSWSGRWVVVLSSGGVQRRASCSRRRSVVLRPRLTSAVRAA
jgi:hypothetical protein